MKLGDIKLLTEVPAYDDREMPPHPEQLTHFYSDDTLTAEWILFHQYDDHFELYMHKNHTVAFIGKRGVRQPRMVSGIHAYITAEFKHPQDLSSTNPGLQLPGALQIDVVEAHNDASKRFGLGTRLYWGIAEAGITVISDTKQYKGGRALWLKLAKDQGSKFIVNVIRDGHPVMNEAGNKPLVWDGTNIDETELWNPSVKSIQFHTLFVLRKK